MKRLTAPGLGLAAVIVLAVAAYAAAWTPTFKERVVAAAISLVPADVKAKLPQGPAAVKAAVQRAAEIKVKTPNAQLEKISGRFGAASPEDLLVEAAALAIAFVDETAPRADKAFFQTLDASPEVGIVHFDGYHLVSSADTLLDQVEEFAAPLAKRIAAADEPSQDVANDTAALFNLYVNVTVDLWTTAAKNAGANLGRGQPNGARVTPPLNEADEALRPAIDADISAAVTNVVTAAKTAGALTDLTLESGGGEADEFVFDEGVSVSGQEAQDTASQLANSDVHVDSAGVDRMKGLDEGALKALENLGIDVRKTRREFRVTRGGVKPGQILSTGDINFKLDNMSSIELGSRDKRAVFMQLSDSALETGVGGGSLNQKVVAAVIGANVGGIKACFERRLREVPDLSGRVFVEFTIGLDGNVARVELLENTSGDGPFAECLGRQVNRLRFPPPEGGEVTFVFPFIFEQAF